MSYSFAIYKHGFNAKFGKLGEVKLGYVVRGNYKFSNTQIRIIYIKLKKLVNTLLSLIHI